MTTPQKYLGRKAVKATLRHGVRGTASKARRDPMRALTLLGVGALAGAVGGWILGRRSTGTGDPYPAYQPPAPAAATSTAESKAAAAA